MNRKFDMIGLFVNDLHKIKGIIGTFELAINVGAPEKVDLTFKKLVKAGASPIYEPRDEPWNMRSSMVADPEGNLIEIGSDFWE
ncbi:MAG: VOC family protein [Promethearchaeota archaeon]